MNAISELEKLGYSFTLEGDKIRYAHTGDLSDPVIARPLLEELKQHKVEAIQYLKDMALKTRLAELSAALDGVSLHSSPATDYSESVASFDLYDADLDFWFRGLSINRIVTIAMQSNDGDRISIFPQRGWSS